MKVLVLGGSGVTGTRAVRLALKRGYDVVATHFTSPPSVEDERVTWIKADVDDAKTIRELLDGVEPDAVLDFHAYNNVDACEDEGAEQCWKTNAVAPGLWARECRERGIKYVWISTDFVFDGTSPPYTEDDVPNPLSRYAKAKLVGEQRALLEDAVVLRTAVVFDANKRSKFLGWVLKNLREGNEVPAFVDQLNNPTWAMWLAEAALEALRLQGPELLHAVGKDCVSRYEFAKLVAEVLGFPSGLVKPTCSCDVKQKAQRPKKNCLSTEKIERVLGLKPPRLEDAIKGLAKELKELWL